MITQRRRTRAAGTAVVATLVLAGCSRAEPDPVADVPAFDVDAPEVTLLEAGSDPRPLAFDDASEPDRKPWETTVRISSGFAQSVASATEVDPTAPAGGDVDTATFPLSVTSRPAPPPGAGERDADRRVDITVGQPTHTDLDLSQDLASAEGFALSLRASTSGQVDTLKLLPPPESSEMARSTTESNLLTLVSTNVVFPTEPVGIGGSWSVESRRTGESGLQRTTTYTVTGIDGDTVTLDADVAERPMSSQLRIDNDVAGDLNGATLNVSGETTSAQGSITVDTHHALPVSGMIAATTRVVYSGPNPELHVMQDITSSIEYGS